MNVHVIKSEDGYEAALLRVEALMDAEPGSPYEEELELLALLVEKYEAEHYPIDLPDPVEAIKFRMEQEGLAPKDMIKYLGSQSKVSEVLNHKRQLSLSMIRALSQGLDIPAEVLIQPPAQPATLTNIPEPSEPAEAYRYFKCQHLHNEYEQNKLRDWQIITSKKVKKLAIPQFSWDGLDNSLFKELVWLSTFSAGPLMTRELLNNKGIYLVVQKIPFESDIDGACFFTAENHPVIVMTLRTNRLDDFWFTLFHLLAHLYLHRDEEPITFFDSLPCVFDKDAPVEEEQVNLYLKEALIPAKNWEPIFRTYRKNQNWYSFEQALRTLEASPEIITCLARLAYRNLEIDELVPILPVKKVSEKLEVYG